MFCARNATFYAEMSDEMSGQKTIYSFFKVKSVRNCDSVKLLPRGALSAVKNATYHSRRVATNFDLCLMLSWVSPFNPSPLQGLKEITHLRHFFENIANNFHNTVFHSLFRNTYYFPN